MITTTPHKSASSSIHWSKFCLLSSLFHFHPFFSICSFEPHHSFPFSVFLFRPHTLSIIPHHSPSIPLLLSSIFLSSLITSVSSLSWRQPHASKWKHFLFIFSFFFSLKITFPPTLLSHLRSVSLLLFVHQCSQGPKV